jgi:hypothetical protein
MLNVTESKDRIANVLLFFQVALHLFEQYSERPHQTSEAEEDDVTLRDNQYSRMVVEPILELVYRIYTDDQYKESRCKELSIEIVDYLSSGMNKSFFINAYN